MNNKIRQFSYRDLPKRVYNIEEKVKEIEGGGDVTVSWVDIEGKPATFAPTIGTTASTAKAGNYQPTWSQVTGKPATFTPSAHTHVWADITDKPATFTPTIGTTATTAKAGNYQPTWAQVTGKPTTFAPAAHTHVWADITDKPTLFSGNYNDLTNKPTIPTVGNGTITITQGGNTKGSFTTNQSGNTTIDIDAGGGSVSLGWGLSYDNDGAIQLGAYDEDLSTNTMSVPINSTQGIGFIDKNNEKNGLLVLPATIAMKHEDFVEINYFQFTQTEDENAGDVRTNKGDNLIIHLLQNSTPDEMVEIKNLLGITVAP